MVRPRMIRLRTAALLALGLVFLLTMVVYAEDPPFAGKWRGESRAAAAPSGGPGVTGGPVGAGSAPATGTPAAAAPEVGGAPAATPGGGGRAGGGGRGGFGGGSSGPQKVSLNLKQSKDNKLSGNITFGEGETVDVKDGKVDGNTIIFKAGRAPQPVYEYKGELKGNELILTRDNPGGRGAAPQYVLTKK
jgi:hypothetical protein